MKLSNNTNRKFTEELLLEGWKVETEDGYKPIISSNKTVEYEVYEIVLEDNMFIKCADTHILIKDNYEEIYAKDSLNSYIRTKIGNKKVIKVINLGYKEKMYDLSINSKEHTYYTNDILSHNSVTIATYLLWKAITTPNINIGIAANVQKLAVEVLDKIKKIYIEMPIWLQPGLISWNKQTIEFDNGTKIMTSATNGDSFRGYSIHILYCDEVAFIKPNIWEEFSDSVFPAQDALAEKQTILSSTAGGLNHFYFMVEGARKELIEKVDGTYIVETDNGFLPIDEIYDDYINEKIQITNLKHIKKIDEEYNITFIHGSNGYRIEEANWQEVPRWNKDGSIKPPEQFKKEQIAKNGVLFWNQNFGNEFLGSSSTLISGTFLKSIDIINDDEIIHNTIFNGLRIFEEPKKDKAYILTVDPKVDGSDKVGIHVIDVTSLPFKQVAAANLEETYLLIPSRIFDLGVYYHNALIVVENNMDMTIADALYYQYEYEGEIFKEKVKKKSYNNRLGFRTTKKTKKIIISMFKKFIEENMLIINDKQTLNEMFNFIEKKNGTYSAEEGYNDDLIMSLMLVFAPFINIKNWENFRGFVELIEMKQQEEEQEEIKTLEFLDLGFGPSSLVPVSPFTKGLWDD